MQCVCMHNCVRCVYNSVMEKISENNRLKFVFWPLFGNVFLSFWPNFHCRFKILEIAKFRKMLPESSTSLVFIAYSKH